MLRIKSMLRSAAGKVKRTVIFGSRPGPQDYGQPLLGEQEGNIAIGDALSGSAPFFACRLGATELNCAAFFDRWRRGRIKLPFPRNVGRAMQMSSGFFPVDESHLDRFSADYLAAVSEADLIGVWYNHGEQIAIRRYAPRAHLTLIGALECFRRPHPWSAQLAGKCVLVIHPFSASIASQYMNHRRDLFLDQQVLPDFELKTIRAVQSVAGNPVEYGTWFDALNHMCELIDRETYDVAIVGAGAYGLPLGAHVKRRGKQAIHMGGSTQLLFGVKGKRWENDPSYAAYIGSLFNEHWVRPATDEIPSRADTVENGAYW